MLEKFFCIAASNMLTGIGSCPRLVVVGWMLLWTTDLGDGSKGRGVPPPLGIFTNVRVLRSNLVQHIGQIAKFWHFTEGKNRGVYILALRREGYFRPTHLFLHLWHCYPFVLGCNLYCLLISCKLLISNLVKYCAIVGSSWCLFKISRNRQTSLEFLFSMHS